MGHHDMVKQAVVKGARSFVVKPVTEENLDNFLSVIKSVVSDGDAAQSSEAKPQAVPEYAKVFFDTAFKSIEQIIGAGKVAKETVGFQRTTNAGSEGVSVVIGITGSLKGHLVVDMSQKTALKVAGTMNMEEFLDLNDLAMSSLGKIGNMISSGAVMGLNSMDCRLNTTTPIVFFGKCMAISTLSLTTLQVLPIKTPEGIITIKLAIMKVAGS